MDNHPPNQLSRTFENNKYNVEKCNKEMTIINEELSVDFIKLTSIIGHSKILWCTTIIRRKK